MFRNKFSWERTFSFLLGLCLEVEWLGLRVTLSLITLGPLSWFSAVLAPFYTPTGSSEGCDLHPHLLSSGVLSPAMPVGVRWKTGFFWYFRCRDRSLHPERHPHKCSLCFYCYQLVKSYSSVFVYHISWVILCHLPSKFSLT